MVVKRLCGLSGNSSQTSIQRRCLPTKSWSLFLISLPALLPLTTLSVMRVTYLSLITMEIWPRFLQVEGKNSVLFFLVLSVGAEAKT